MMLDGPEPRHLCGHMGVHVQSRRPVQTLSVLSRLFRWRLHQHINLVRHKFTRVHDDTG